MSPIALEHYLALALMLFCVGLYGALTRRNAVGILMSIELLFNAVNINLVAFSHYLAPSSLTGQVFAVFVIGVAAAEAAVGIAIVLSIYRNFDSINVDEIHLLKW